MRVFRGDQTKDHHAVVGYFAQGLEGTGARIVILEQQPLSTQVPKNGLRDKVVSTLDQPTCMSRIRYPMTSWNA
jgi:hypothetical protein